MSVGKRFRAWCLSWDDTEEEGRDIEIYSIANHDFSKEDRRATYLSDLRFRGLASVAVAYAEYVHAQRDGWESTWPLTFRVRDLDGTTADFEVDRETVPHFTAAPVKEKR